MSASTIELLNQILINTFVYKKELSSLSEQVHSEETCLKLKDFANRRKKQANELIQIINTMGGDVQSTPNRTDAPKLSWCADLPPKNKDTIALLTYLITVEEKSLEEYQKVWGQISNSEIESRLKVHIKQGETTLKYLKTALHANQESKKANANNDQ
ncbi:hypothetical protein [Croceitalea dokdonensis]|nr:hypothetical protein [Croceitalea dokdonensis]